MNARQSANHRQITNLIRLDHVAMVGVALVIVTSVILPYAYAVTEFAQRIAQVFPH